MVMTVDYLPREDIEAEALGALKRAGIVGPHIAGSAVNPIAVCTAENIEVFVIDLADDSVCGILRKEDDKYKIYVNQDHSGNRIRYTIAHELGHYFLHRHLFDTFVDEEINLYRVKALTEDYPDKARMETQANMFAAALLMPENFVRDQLRRTRDMTALAKFFGVSREAMGYRIANLGL